jgi:adenylate cyclase
MSPLVAVLGRRKEPVVDGPTAGGRGAGLSLVGRAVLQEMGVALVAPVPVEDRLEALICLGEKRSGDLFTASEVAWIAAVADRMGAELLRMRASAEIERGRELQDAYRAWVPGSLAEQIERGDALEEGEREVTVLFVDIRGYTSFAERRRSSEVFSIVNRYTNEMSRAVEGHGGTVVDFSGDGVMAVFGAPRPLADKELAAVAAAEEILRAMQGVSGQAGAQLQVGIGIASGPAFVGSIRASDRRIWTALGATTNLAARLQTLCRELGAAALIDEATWRRAGERAARFERRADVAIRGLSEARVVYARPLA